MVPARLVIIRPGGSKGIRREIEHALRTVPSEQTLFYLRFRGRKRERERAYVAFRRRLQAARAVELPERLDRALYLIFDASCYPRFARQAGCPADLFR